MREASTFKGRLASNRVGPDNPDPDQRRDERNAARRRSQRPGPTPHNPCMIVRWRFCAARRQEAARTGTDTPTRSSVLPAKKAEIRGGLR